MIDESDWHLLEGYLDDALTADEVAALDGRLEDEPELAASLDQMRAQRAARSVAWHAVEANAAEAHQLAGKILLSVRQRERRRTLVRWGKAMGLSAACLTLGFSLGWLGRGHATPLAQKQPVARQNMDVASNASAPKPAEAGGAYEVALTDENGNVVATQKFSRVEDARQFADDWGQMEARRRQVQQGRAMLVSEQF